MHNTNTSVADSQNNTESLWRFEKSFGTPVIIDSTDSEKEDDLNCNILSYRHPLSGFSRDTCQMSPLLFESDTDDTLQSTPTECYQRPIIAPPLTKPSNKQIFDILSTLTEIRNKISNQLDSPLQHNQCCSETLLNSSDDRRFNQITKANTDNAISPSPRVTRSKLLNSRVLTRSSKRLHKVNLLNTTLRKPRTKKEVHKGKKGKTKNTTKNSNVKQTEPCDSNDEAALIESIQKSKPMVCSQRLQSPPILKIFEKVDEEFIQPNIVPNIELVDKADIELDFSVRRPSSDVQILSPAPTIISLSSESSQKSTKLVTIKSETKPRCESPDLFEGCDSNSVLDSQYSFDIPNGQVLLSSQPREELYNNDPSNYRHSSSDTPTFVDVFTNHSTTAVEASRDILMDESKNAFEITANDMFPNVIQIDSDSEITSAIPENVANEVSNVARTQQGGLNELIDLTKSSSSLQITPKRQHNFLNQSKNSQQSGKLTVTPLNRTSRWLSKRSSNDLNRTPYRSRRLDLWFKDDVGDIDEPTSTNKTIKRKMSERKTISKMLLSSDENEDS